MEKHVILTKEGKEKLEKELQELKTVRRKEVADRIKQAIDFGDISENSEYDDAKNEQAFIEGRIQELDMMLRNVQIIDEEITQADVISIGSTVSVRDVELDELETYRIVGTVEADPMQNKISNESPVVSLVKELVISSMSLHQSAPSNTKSLKYIPIRRELCQIK